MSILDLGAKECARCEQVKRLTEFPRNRTKKDGHSSWCLVCTRDWNADYVMGVRRREISGIRANVGPFICVDPVAQLGPDNKCCTNCGYPVASRMDPDLYWRVVAKRPSIEDQIVIERQAVPA